jgi:ectoine hydroxylase-related dioxygenase (phytanoyl-CoA dioxygenase family)
LDAAQVSALLQCYEQVKDAHEAINIPFITTSHSNNADLIGKVNQEILNIVENSILEEISNGEIIFSNFLIKKSGEKSESNPHQDLSIVDEQKFFSFSVWIALSNNNPLNGAMRFFSKKSFIKAFH